MGPFRLAAYEPGQRLTFERNPHYWRRNEAGEPLPYLDGVVLDIVPDQNAELLRLQSGAIDMTQQHLRAEDYAPVRELRAQGRRCRCSSSASGSTPTRSSSTCGRRTGPRTRAGRG